MIRNIIERQFTNDLKYIEAVGLYTDTKPTGTIITGSLFFEVDTGDVYVYEETGENWNKIGG